MVSALITKYCAGISASLVAALISIESGGNAKAYHDGNYGLMQIRLNTAKFLQCEVQDPNLCGVDKSGVQIQSCTVSKPEHLYNAATNVKCGCKYLRFQKKRYHGNKQDMAAAYNLGSVFKNEDGTYKNQQYVNDVMERMKK